MPTVHKTIRNYQPMDYGGDLTRIDDLADQLKPRIREIFSRWCSTDLDDDDLGTFVGNVKLALMYFALDCNALPLRTPRRLMATVKHIAKHPAEFLSSMGSYDPEAAALVIGACAAMSTHNRNALLQFEIGNGAGPLPSDIVRAAAIVLERLEATASGQRRGGRPELVLQRELAMDLAMKFLNRGGKVTRTVGDGETGPFHEFLELLLPLIQPHACQFALNRDPYFASNSDPVMRGVR